MTVTIDDIASGKPSYQSALPAPEIGEGMAELDDFIQRKGKVLGSKLEVLAAEVLLRLDIRKQNLQGIDEDKERAATLLNRVSRLCNYHLAEPQEKNRLQQQFFDAEVEKRQEHVEAWKDVTRVMRDLIDVWEAHEGAQSKARLLSHAG